MEYVGEEQQNNEKMNRCVKKTQQRITQLINVMIETPFDGLGNPEALKHSLSGYWSRRISKEHRIVYKFEEDKITIIALRFHY